MHNANHENLEHDSDNDLSQELGSQSAPPTSLCAPISPPPSRTRHRKHSPNNVPPKTSTIEAGKAHISDHLRYWTSHLSQHIITLHPPSLSISDFKNLYTTHANNPTGHHFVIHQHDHPVAGLHYDLRLQINETSSASWAIMYGLPGNANSRRINRNAMETRVHCLWNHLIETASEQTGSMLIWDTGSYEVLPYHVNAASSGEETTDEDDDEVEENTNACYRSVLSEPQKLAEAFQNRKIRLRLHGAHLPKNYTISLRLQSSEDRAQQPKAPSRKRKRGQHKPKTENIQSSDEDEVIHDDQPTQDGDIGIASDSEGKAQENEQIRITNAYVGANNTINSIHQRRWYMSLDRRSSGFVPQTAKDEVSGERKRNWVRKRRKDGNLEGFETFFVLGAEAERSVVTGRTAREVMRDEGVSGYEGRKGWRAVLE